MKRNITKVVLLIFLFCFLHNLFGGIPPGINYQGRYEEAGQPVTGTRTFRFNLYNAATGGTLLWSSGDVNINVVDGLFNYVLNCGGIDWRSNDVYLEITVGGTTLSPRERIQASAYAFYSSSAAYAYNTAQLGGYSPSYFLNTSATAQQKQGELSCLVGGTTFYMVPRGAIIMWSGSAASIPAGWALCDGTNGTPDLRDKFIIAAGGTYSPGATGGTTSHTHSVDIAAFTSAAESSHTHSINPPSATTSSAGSHDHIVH
ncbi:MAG: phage tail protein, partial [Endomicrobia bacterium]|nr:phage tail protein [Endomicrobiia bacterium]